MEQGELVGDFGVLKQLFRYGKPLPGSKSEARAKKYNESCMREILQLCGLIAEKGWWMVERYYHMIGGGSGQYLCK